jgi:regulatory protein
MPPPTSYQKALQLLATRAHFRRELEVKLRQRRYPEEEIEAALARLTEQGYLDDRATARVFVESRQERASEGWARLWSELIERGRRTGAGFERPMVNRNLWDFTPP